MNPLANKKQLCLQSQKIKKRSLNFKGDDVVNYYIQELYP